MSAGGIYAFYPTRVRFHYVSPTTRGRNVIGEIVERAHGQGLKVIARLDFSRAREDVYAAHPEWFERAPGGEPRRIGAMFATCPLAGYQNEEFAFGVFRELLEEQNVDGFHLNAHGFSHVCHCATCARGFGAPIPGDEPAEADARERFHLWRCEALAVAPAEVPRPDPVDSPGRLSDGRARRRRVPRVGVAVRVRPAVARGRVQPDAGELRRDGGRPPLALVGRHDRGPHRRHRCPPDHQQQAADARRPADARGAASGRVRVPVLAGACPRRRAQAGDVRGAAHAGRSEADAVGGDRVRLHARARPAARRLRTGDPRGARVARPRAAARRGCRLRRGGPSPRRVSRALRRADLPARSLRRHP